MRKSLELNPDIKVDIQKKSLVIYFRNVGVGCYVSDKNIISFPEVICVFNYWTMKKHNHVYMH